MQELFIDIYHLNKVYFLGMDNIGGSTPITVKTVYGTKTLYVKPKKRLKTDHSLEEKLRRGGGGGGGGK